MSYLLTASHLPIKGSIRFLILVFLLGVLMATAFLSKAYGQQTISFSKVTSGDVASNVGNSQGASWVDINNDGFLDLFVANVGSQINFLYQNLGDGTFERVLTGDIASDQISSIGTCWADYDNDDDLDAFVSGPASTLYQNDGTGNFSKVVNTTGFGLTDMRGWACAWADYDLDGYVDLIVSHPAGFLGTPVRSNLLFHNEGDGTFANVLDTPITQNTAAFTVPSWSDYDMDGDPDLFIGSGPASAVAGLDYLYRNLSVETGTATFERITEGELASTARDGQVINWIDYDNDGDLDSFVTNWGGNMGGLADELFRNDDGVLTRISSGALVTDREVSLASVWADFDNDADLDVFVADGSGGRPNRLYENNGDGTFSKRTGLPVTSDINVSWGASAGDYDNDGDLDLFVANAQNGSRNFLYRNDLAAGRHWLKVLLSGTTSNSSAIGARVRAKATIDGEAVWQLREVSSQNSFNGHNSLVVHFGLLDAEVVDSLQITWPSGQVEIYEDIASDQYLLAREGSAVSPVSNTLQDILPEQMTLDPPYPNPFRGQASIGYSLARTSTVTLSVFDLLGREVAQLVDASQGPGKYTVKWEPATKRVPAGIYMYRLQTHDAMLTRSIVLLP